MFVQTMVKIIISNSVVTKSNVMLFSCTQFQHNNNNNNINNFYGA